MNAQTLEEFDQEIQIDQWELSHLTAISMEMGRRHGLGSKAQEFEHLPKKQKMDRLEALINFIQKANEKRYHLGEDPNMYRDLREEFRPAASGTPHAPRNGRAAEKRSRAKTEGCTVSSQQESTGRLHTADDGRGIRRGGTS